MSTDNTTLGVIAGLEIAHALLTLNQHGNTARLLAPGVDPCNTARGHVDTVLRALRGPINDLGVTFPGSVTTAQTNARMPRTDDDASVMAQKLAPRNSPYLTEDDLKARVNEVAEKANAASKRP